MENSEQNSPNATPENITDGNSLIESHSQSAQGINAGQKKERLAGDKNMNSEVSDYLNDLNIDASYLKVGGDTAEQKEKIVPKQSIIRTYQSDAQEAIKMEHMSSVSMAVAQQRKKLKDQTISPSVRAPTNARLFLIVSLFFMFAGAGVFGFLYVKQRNNTVSQSNSIKAPSLIMADSNVEFNLNGNNQNNAAKSLSEIINNASIKLNSIQNIYITENFSKEGKVLQKTVDSMKFLSLIGAKMPDSLLRSLTPEYMLGIHSWNSNQPFIILKTDSYENAFAGMLSWEKSMADELGDIFSLDRQDRGEEITNTEQILNDQKDFEDILIKNKNARALRNRVGDIYLIYSLPNKDTIIITTNTATVAELFDRIIRSKATR